QAAEARFLGTWRDASDRGSDHGRGPQSKSTHRAGEGFRGTITGTGTGWAVLYLEPSAHKWHNGEGRFDYPLALWGMAGLWLAQSAIGSGHTVTLDQLAHRVPMSAAREYGAAQKAIQEGDVERAMEHCRKAIDRDPSNAAAHNDLGVLLLAA